MKTICNNCQTRLKIPDHKISSGRPAAFACPKCKNNLKLDQGQNGSEQISRIDPGDTFLDFIDDESQTALVCEQNLLVRKTIKDALSSLGYRITAAENTRDALKRMRYYSYGLVVVNEDFDTDNPEINGILIYLERLSMTVRRNMYVVMVNNRYRTMDNMIALNRSVNLVINVKNTGDIGKILSRGITDNKYFYSVFKQTLIEVGRV